MSSRSFFNVDAQGELQNAISLRNSAAKGKSDGIIWMNNDLKAALIEYRNTRKFVHPDTTIIRTERHENTSPQVIVNKHV